MGLMLPVGAQRVLERVGWLCCWTCSGGTLKCVLALGCVQGRWGHFSPIPSSLGPHLEQGPPPWAPGSLSPCLAACHEHGFIGTTLYLGLKLGLFSRMLGVWIGQERAESSGRDLHLSQGQVASHP